MADWMERWEVWMSELLGMAALCWRFGFVRMGASAKR